jgi:hypothetical protein
VTLSAMAGVSATRTPVSSATSSMDDESSSTTSGAGLVGGGGSLHERSGLGFEPGPVGGTNAGVPIWVEALEGLVVKGPRALALAAATSEGAGTGATAEEDEDDGTGGELGASAGADATAGADAVGEATFTGDGVAASAPYDGRGVGGAMGT